MSSGSGNDVFVVQDSGDIVVEAAGGGIDEVRASVDYVLTDNVETLVLSGAARAGTGNALGNTITGTGGTDTLSGLDGDDRLIGGVGADRLDGGAGADVLTGGTGIDRLAGGLGADRFVFGQGDTGATRQTADRIVDFLHSDHDRIDLDAIDANALADGDQAFRFVGTSAFSGTAGELHFVVVKGLTVIEGDTNGDKVADVVIALDGTHVLVSTDFML